MLRLALRQLWARGGRTLALGLAVVVAATGFTALTASSRAAQLETVGLVNRQAEVGYDILVRPREARDAVEREHDLIEPGFLSGTYGGITVRQWHRIQRIAGVQVAAPIAMVGYATPSLRVAVPTSNLLGHASAGIGRVDVSWSADQGLTHVTTPPDFVFETRQHLTARNGSADNVPWAIEEHGVAKPICPLAFGDGSPDAQRPSLLTCQSSDGGGDHDLFAGLSGQAVGMYVSFPYPFLIAAIDPSSEQKLDGLGNALVSGKALAGAPLHSAQAYSGGASVPVLVANEPQTSLRAQISVSTVPSPAAIQKVLNGASGNALRGFRHTHVSTVSVSSRSLYPRLLKVLAGSKTNYRNAGNVSSLFTVSEPQWRQGSGVLIPRVVPSGLSKMYIDPLTGAITVTGEDTAVRRAAYHEGPSDGGMPTPASLFLRGIIDPSHLRGLTSVTRRVLNGLLPVPLSGADSRSRGLLHHQQLLPSANVAGLAQPSPLMLTTLKALGPLEQGWSGSTDSAAPISAIRVKVAGVTGIDPVSRARVQLAAQRIRQQTGLEVDLTIGSSATDETISLPAGRSGRPGLLLHQSWVKKGVATTIIDAVDRKSVALFVLVLLVSALTMANAAIASVRSRRTELGVLACVGWPASALFRTTVAELGIVAGIAGIVSFGLSLLVGQLIGTPISVARAALAVPAAIAVALVAGLVPAVLASRADPLDAVNPPITAPRRARPVGDLFAMARLNLARVRSRTVLAAVGLALATLVFTVLLGLAIGFQGSVVGSVLGNAVAIQVRTVDYVAAAAILVLASLGVANLMYLNIRERGPELATLQAVGWTNSHISRLLLGEGLVIGLVGSLAGAVVGYGGTWILVGSLPMAVIGGAVIAALTGVLLALVGTAVANLILRRLPTTQLLTEQT